MIRSLDDDFTGNLFRFMAMETSAKMHAMMMKLREARMHGRIVFGKAWRN